jgi:hypothetical protein
VTSAAGLDLDDEALGLGALLDDVLSDTPVSAVAPGRGSLAHPAEDLDLDDRPGADPALSWAGVPSRDELTLAITGDPVAQLVGLEHVVRGQQDVLP